MAVKVQDQINNMEGTKGTVATRRHKYYISSISYHKILYLYLMYQFTSVVWNELIL